jgi:outer membrane protein W
MKHVVALFFAVATAAPALAQRHVMIFVDSEGVRRSNKIEFQPNVITYEPRFDTGGGVGGGLNFFFGGERVSLETKVAALESRLHLRRTGSDFVTVADLGYAQIYPITAILQWHMLEGTAFRPYIGAGAGYIILRNIKKDTFGLTGVNFGNPVGLVVDGGVELSFSKRWSILADARYTPIESKSHVTFLGVNSEAEIRVRPLIVSAGIGFRF